MAQQIVKMDPDAVAGALTATADVIKDIYYELSDPDVTTDATRREQYADLSQQQVAFSNSIGFEDALTDVLDAVLTEITAGGGSCPTDITNIFSAAKAGSFTVPSDVGGTEGDTYTITHNLGVVPDIVLVWTPDLAIKYRDSTGTNNALIYALWINNQENTTDNYKNFVVKVSTSTYPGQYSGNQYQVAFRGNTPTSTVAVLNLTTSILPAKKHVGTAEESVVRYVWIAAKLATSGGGS